MPQFSPGVVEDNELILRELFNPQHVGDDGEIVPAAISLQDLRERGFSVHRMKYVTREFIESSIKQRLAKPRSGKQWKEEGVAKIVVRKIRELKLQDRQAFVVIDTALENNRGHASIFFANREIDKADTRELRSLLLPMLKKRMTIDEAFGNRDNPPPALTRTCR